MLNYLLTSRAAPSEVGSNPPVGNGGGNKHALLQHELKLSLWPRKRLQSLASDMASLLVLISLGRETDRRRVNNISKYRQIERECVNECFNGLKHQRLIADKERSAQRTIDYGDGFEELSCQKM